MDRQYTGFMNHNIKETRKTKLAVNCERVLYILYSNSVDVRAFEKELNLAVWRGPQNPGETKSINPKSPLRLRTNHKLSSSLAI